MGRCKVWYKLEGEYEYQIAIKDQIPELDAGYYTTEVLFRDETGRMLFQVGDFYIVSDKISDDLSFDTNVPQWGTSREFVITDITPSETRTLFQNGNSYIALINDPLIVDIRAEYYNDGLVKDDIFDLPRWDRNGIFKTFYRSWTKELGVVPRYGLFFNFSFTANDNEVVFKVLEGESESQVKNDAFTAMNTNKRNYKVEAAGNWNGHYRSVSSGITGKYEPFGDSIGNITVGHLQYTDTEDNPYVLDFDIIETETDIYSVISKINEQTYTRNGRPTDSNVTFTNTELPPAEQNLDLNFDTYVESSRITYAFDTRVDTV
jgi:hypothetical protein